MMKKMPTVLLNAIALKKALNQHLVGGIVCIVLMTDDGAVIGKAGVHPSEKSLGGIMITVWEDYVELGKEVLKQKDMTYTFVTTANSRILARKIESFILLIKSNKETELGILKAKSDIINELIADQIDKLSVMEQTPAVTMPNKIHAGTNRKHFIQTHPIRHLSLIHI
eukprot:TRINITY_DN4711_c0_g1_i2.p2 TRINITY_DN4711_c0_g1~~TRINITY_DN4711_c0_g1_i2.p2  ORF type:complete len:168 (-),score=25.85 TRINITY_DN4711_c0_g1_i2:62-565(-)